VIIEDVAFTSAWQMHRRLQACFGFRLSDGLFGHAKDNLLCRKSFNDEAAINIMAWRRWCGWWWSATMAR
jgi:hypothetical protein